MTGRSMGYNIIHDAHAVRVHKGGCVCMILPCHTGTLSRLDTRYPGSSSGSLMPLDPEKRRRQTCTALTKGVQYNNYCNFVFYLVDRHGQRGLHRGCRIACIRRLLQRDGLCHTGLGKATPGSRALFLRYYKVRCDFYDIVRF